MTHCTARWFSRRYGSGAVVERVARLLRRLHVATRVEAAALAGRVGLEQLPEG
jgi:hypothetical protein